MTQGASIVAVAEVYDAIASPGAMSLAVADAYDAMTSDRPYRPAMTTEATCAELEKGKGTQFDPVIVNTFMKLLKKGRV
jgi:HD-GYP domain-containing protein (c-di-GMP phosphodiesterase class II)